MKKVYQKIIDKDHGDCMQAVVASLFDLRLEAVPRFIDIGSGWFIIMMKFFKDRGYDICTIDKHQHQYKGSDFLKKVAYFDGGIDGYFYASVKSKLFEGGGHAVIVDKDLKVIHDPNPNGLYLNAKPEDIEDIMVVHDMIIGKTGKIFTQEEWDKCHKKEKDENTYRVKFDDNNNVIGSES